MDEEGALSLSSTRPALGTVLTAVPHRPDGVTDGTAVWQWERSTGRNAWAVIDGAAAAGYTPVAADTNTFLRVTATYEDEHGTGKTVSEVAPNVVTGPLLTRLKAETDDSVAERERSLYPAFDPLTLHYGIGCNSTDTLVLTVSAAANARVGVAGVQAAGASMSVDVSEDSDVAIRVTDASGAGTTYVVHCLPEVFFDIETHTFPNTDAFEDLILFNRDNYLRLIDRNGVPRLHLGFPVAGAFAVRFYRIGADGAYRYAFRAGSPGYTILDEDFEVVHDSVRTELPLTSLNNHDFQVLEDGNYLLMGYEPAMRDFSDIDLPYLEGADVSSVNVEDATVQIITPVGEEDFEEVFTWNSWDHTALEDCVQHRFPVTLSTDPAMRTPNRDYAHINGMHVVDGVLVASMRGCSKVLGIDVEPGATRGDVLWRMGRSNLSDAEWAARDIGPRPLDFVNDPEGEFCGQHTARFLPNGNVFLFDNGVVCTIDPWMFEELGREGDDFSRAVEYALDLENHEAVFVRDHSLRGKREHLAYANGTVDVLDNGDWLVSWGRPLNANDPVPNNEAATLVDPATGQEKLGIRFRVAPSGRLRRLDATVAPAEALAPQPVPLTAEFPASAATSLFHTGVGDSPQVVVAFNRPVVDFTAATPSVSVSGAAIESVSPHIVAGEAANAYVVTLTPTGAGAITVGLVAGRPCVDGGICTADGAGLETSPGAVTIPGPVIVSVQGDVTVAEGESTTIVVILQPAHGRAGDVEVPLSAHSGSTAVPGSDYDLPASVTFGPADPARPVTLTTAADSLVEGAETVVIAVGSPLPGGFTAGTTATATIGDATDATLTLTVGSAEVAEGNSTDLTFSAGAGITFTTDQTIAFTLGGTAQADDYTVSAGGATLSAPYSLTLPAGENAVAATLRAVDETSREDAETVVVEATHDAVAIGSRTVTILASDHPIVTVRSAGGSPMEGTELTFTLTNTEPASDELTVAVLVEETGRMLGGAPPVEATFAAGSSSTTLTVATTDDRVAEADSEVTVTVLPSSADTYDVGRPRSASVTVTDDDGPPSTRLDLSLSPSTVSEAAVPTEVVVTGSLNAGARATETVVTVTVGASTDSATEGVDYMPVSGPTLTILANETTGQTLFTLSPENDVIAEGAETITVSGRTNGLTVEPATLTLSDNDTASSIVTLAVDPESVSEDTPEDVTVTASLNAGARAEDTEVRLTVGGAAGDTAEPGTDYEPVSERTLTILAGETGGTAVFRLEPVNNESTDGARTLSVTGSTTVAELRIEPASGAKIALRDDDSPGVRVVPDTLTVVEAGSGTYTVALQTRPTADVTVTIDGVSGDLSLNKPSLVFTQADWRDAQDVQVTAADDDDNLRDPDVTLTHRASGAAEYRGLSADLVVSILENDPGLAFSETMLTVPEGETATYTVALAIAPTADVAVTIEGVSGDLSLDRTDLVFTPTNWDAAQTVTVTAAADEDASTDPAVTLRHTASGGGYDSVYGTVRVTITENDSGGGTGGGGGGGGAANIPPVVEREIDDQTLDVGEVLAVDIRLNFYDRNQRALDYTVTSADPSVAAAEVDRNGLLTIRGVRRGVTAVTVTAADRRDERASDTFVVTVKGPALVALVPRAADPMREGFVRVINHGDDAGEVSIEAIDDTGGRYGPVALTMDAGETVHFNSGDLEDGNAAKGLAEGVGTGEGDWRLVFDSDLDVEVLAYIRTEDGFLTGMHDTVPLRDGAYRVAIFNPGSNPNQVSRLRLINPGERAAAVTVAGVDDAGASPGTAVEFELPAGESLTLSASELEAGAGVDGALGDGTGKWRLRVISNEPVVAMSLLSSPTGHLTNLSTVPGTPDEGNGDHVVPLFPSASDPLGRQGFVRVVNRSTEAGDVRIEAYDDSDVAYEAVTLSIGVGATVHFNSNDLELGSAAKGLSGSTGAGGRRLAAGAVERTGHRRARLHPHRGRGFDLDARCGARAGGRAPCGDLQSGQQPEPGELAAAGQPGDGGRRGDSRRHRRCGCFAGWFGDCDGSRGRLAHDRRGRPGGRRRGAERCAGGRRRQVAADGGLGSADCRDEPAVEPDGSPDESLERPRPGRKPLGLCASRCKKKCLARRAPEWRGRRRTLSRHAFKVGSSFGVGTSGVVGRKNVIWQ